MTYLDCAATTPPEPRVLDRVLQFLRDDFGNAGSRTHEFGARARRAVERARDQVAAVAGATRGEVIFTSGATESNNLALLGLAEHGLSTGRTHIVSMAIEHPAVMEPLQRLAARGFTITWLAPNSGGWVGADSVRAALRPETLLVSVMHVNNETGVIQPVEEIAETLGSHPAFFHVDAAQSFGKIVAPLRHRRIDLISVSGHKLYAPKGVGALILRKRDGARPPLSPLLLGGGQELGLRPGTQPVALIAGLGLAAELAATEELARTAACLAFRRAAIEGLAPAQPVFNGAQDRVAPHILNVSFPGLEAEDVVESLRDIVALSTGAACASASFTCSHVLSAMGIGGERLNGAVRLSWSHMTERVDWAAVCAALKRK